MRYAKCSSAGRQGIGAAHGADIPFTQLSDCGDHTQWRRFMAERLVMDMDYELFGVKEIYLIGSVEAGEAGVGSDIDLLLHIDGDKEKRARLALWLDGWSRALALANYLRTGHMASHLLDAHFITDQDIRDNGSFAVKIRKPAESSRLVRRT